MAFVTVGKADAVAEGEMARFEVDGTPVAVANVGGELKAFGDTCTHAQCSLAEGELEGTTCVCPCHGSEFDVNTGEVVTPPAREAVPTYHVRIEGEDLQVEV